MGGGPPAQNRVAERSRGLYLLCCEGMCHWHSNFKALAQGIHYRTGMKKPGNVSNTKHNAQILDSLIKLKEFPCVASFTNSKLFHFKFLPNITNSPLHRLLPHLKPLPP